ncbi:MAG: cytochrome bc complex cytochrome b subunit [Anaerolineae bacterium]
MLDTKTISEKVLNWFEDRVGFQELMEVLWDFPIPRRAKTFYLGGITLFFFGVQGVTGVLLSLNYRPTPDQAYESVLFIMNEIRFGWLVRSIHAWSANLMIISSVLHMLRIYVQGAYKAPRELTWMVGILLGTLTLVFGFTGYLLPWDQRAYWATTVGSEMTGAVPLVGPYLLQLVRSGTEISGFTLTRFYGVHILVLPASLGGLLLVHLFLVHRHGLAPYRGATKKDEN